HEYDSPEWFEDLRQKGYPEHLLNHKDVHKPNVPAEGPGDHLPIRFPSYIKAEDAECRFVTKTAIDHIGQRQGTGWFVSLNYIKPHPPRICSAPYNDMYDRVDMPAATRNEEELHSEHPYLKRINENPDLVSDRDLRETQANYWGMITELDAALGELFQYLKGSGQWDNTLILFTSDHGEYLGDHYQTGKGKIYDGTLRVPLIVRDPSPEADVTRGQQLDGFVESIDHSPTMLDFLDIPIPDRFQGTSALGRVRGTGSAKPEVFYERDIRDEVADLISDPDLGLLWVIRDHKYKYVHFADDTFPPLLFDLQADPGEFNNLADGWARCVKMLLPEGQVSGDALLRIIKSLHDQIAYLEVVINEHAGNWPTIGCQGILQTLAALPVFRDTDRWIDYCIETLAKQIDAQILPDGVQDELTPHYHAVVVNNLLTACESLQVLERELDEKTLATLRKLVHYQQQTVVPDGSAQVAFNDSDPEAVPKIVDRLKAVGMDDYISDPDELDSEAFPYAGVAFLRQKASDGDLYLAFDGGPFGRSHQHEDKLGFWLHAYGRNLIVDPGRHLYDNSEASYIPYLRTTQAHSTFIVDGEGQNSRAKRDTWIADAPGSLTFVVSENEVRASSAYDLGYGPGNAIDVVHQREIVFVQEKFWVVFDQVTGEGEHALESRFHFYPGDVVIEGSRAMTQYDDANVLLWSSTEWEDIHVEKGQENPRSGWYSASYSLIEPTPCLSLSSKATLPFISATLLLPYRGVNVPDVAFETDGKRATVRMSGDTFDVKTTLA
ncbi:MAG: sulfatase-like hydrolase/transferase, partial [Candidatus Latescibacteria bacterium]|nr:sulfatase-like hydrolase/transferase [Candidatus Latescibacterota bacterium]